ncbi:hypothetical protein HLB42_21935 (plasmid) [Deinococcus sp. D7000]|nr:hypothetical protein HLB42_21935 [Deinococcus sp. D7000]
MALFGDLQHHALVDLAKVMHRLTGTLVFRSAYHGQTLELVLKTGHLRAIYVEGRPVETLPEARDLLGRLQAQGHGAFEFRTQKLLMDNISFYDQPFAQFISELAKPGVADHQLPHPETRFVRTLNPIQVPAALMPSWTLLKSHLTSDRSATELSARTGLPQREILLALSQLRALDLIAPQRAAVPASTPPVPAARPPAVPSGQGLFTVDDIVPVTLPPTSPAPRPLVQRLLGALRRFTQGGAA